MHLINIHRAPSMQAFHNAENAGLPFFGEYKTLRKTFHQLSLLAARIILKVQLFPRSVPLHPDPRSFGAIVRDCLLEPRMLESLFGRKTLLRIIDEDAAEKIEELLVEGCSRRNDLLKLI